MTALATGITAAVGAGHYLHWGVLSISVTNLLIVIAMLVVFALALFVPFPKPHRQSTPPGKRAGSTDGGTHGGGAS